MAVSSSYTINREIRLCRRRRCSACRPYYLTIRGMMKQETEPSTFARKPGGGAEDLRGHPAAKFSNQWFHSVVRVRYMYA